MNRGTPKKAHFAKLMLILHQVFEAGALYPTLRHRLQTSLIFAPKKQQKNQVAKAPLLTIFAGSFENLRSTFGRNATHKKLKNVVVSKQVVPHFGFCVREKSTCLTSSSQQLKPYVISH